VPPLSELVVRIDADLEGLERGFTAAERAANRLADRMTALGRGLTIGVTLPALAVGAAAVSAAAEMDRLERGLLAVTGSAEKTAEQLDRLEEVAKLPGLGFREAIQGSIRLQAVRIDAGLAERMLVAFGNAVAAAGGGKAELDGVTLALQQIAGKGKVAAEEINQLAERAPQVRTALLDAFGSADTELIQKLKLTSTEFFDRLTAQLERLPRVSGGVSNSFENLSDAFFRARAAIGEVLIPAVLPLVEGLAKLLERVRDLDPNMVRWGVAIGAVAATMGPLLLLVGALTAAVTSLASAIGVGLLPLIAVGGPVVAGLGVLAALLVKNKLDALAAAGAVDAYRASLAGLSGVDLEGEKHALNSRIRDLTRYREALDNVANATRSVATIAPNIREGATIRLQEREVPRISPLITSVGLAALDRQISEAQGKVALIEGLIKQAGTLQPPTSPPIIPTGDLDKLADTFASVNAQLRDFAVASQFGFARVAELPEALQRSFGAAEEARERVDRLADALSKLGALAPPEAFRLLDALRREQRAADEELAAFQNRLANLFQNPPVLEISAEISSQSLRALAVMDTQVGKLTQGIDAQERAWRRTHGALDAYVAVAEGLERVLRGLESVNDGTARMLSDIVELTRAAKQLRDAMNGGALTGLPDFGAALSGAVGVLGTALSLGSQLLGPSARQQEWEAAIDRNTDELNRTRAELAGFRLTFGAEDQVSRALSALDGVQGAIDTVFRTRGAGAASEILEGALLRLGISLDQLNAIAESVNVQILDEKGRLIIGALDQLEEALRLSALSVERFAATIEGQQRLLDARLEIFDVTDPLEKLQGQFALLEQGLAPELLRDFGLANLNLDSSAARAVLEQGLRDMITALGEGAISAQMIAGFESVDEFIKHLLDTDRALDAFTQTANRAATGLVNVVEGFKLARFRFDATRAADAIAPPSGPARPPLTPAGGSGAAVNISGLSIPITIQTSGDGRETYRQLYGEMRRLSLANPSFRPVFELYPEPS
jgi:tape measure domain-containing protein